MHLDTKAHGGLTCPGFPEDSLDSQDHRPEPRASWAVVLSSDAQCVSPELQILWEVLVLEISLAFFTFSGYVVIDSPCPNARQGEVVLK